MGMLIIIDQPPYGTWAGREALDMAFSLAAFDQPASLLFTGDRKSTRLNSSHVKRSRMPSSA